MEYEQVRTLVHTVLKEMLVRVQTTPSYEGQYNHDMQRTVVATQVETLAKSQGQIDESASMSTRDSSFVSQALWELISFGILLPVNAGESGGWPLISLTEFGKEAILQENEYAPFDPTGYLTRLKSNVGNLDGIVEFYADEALGCFRANRFTASTVMLGVASERLFDLLLDAFVGSLSSAEQKSRLQSAVRAKSIVHRYEELKKRVDTKKTQLPSDLRENVEIYLLSVFNLIRYSRNDSGHP